MTTTFSIKPHLRRPDTQVVEILMDGVTVGVMYPTELGIKLVSAHVTDSTLDPEFDGYVYQDGGEGSWPPIPAVVVHFYPSPYTIVDGRIVRHSSKEA